VSGSWSNTLLATTIGSVRRWSMMAVAMLQLATSVN
jgi:hypothetical protein